jgi:hypothetical protein
MKNSHFWVGFLFGTTLSLTLSLAIFYVYVVREIEAVKKETRNEYENLKEFWNKFAKDELSVLKETAIQKTLEKVKELGTKSKDVEKQN